MTELVNTFVEEHQVLMRGLATVLQKVKAGKMAEARTLADKLDQEVGPHIQFEEEVLYPQVGRVRGEVFEQKLRDEHMIVEQAIKQLIAADRSDQNLSELRAELVEALNVAVEHAESCGTLISHLEALSPAVQQQALKRQRQFRAGGVRWTELATRAA